MSNELKGTTENWTETGETIDVPDHLMPLFNKIGIQIRFHTISGKNEILTIAHIVRIAEVFFQSHITKLEAERDQSNRTLTFLRKEVAKVRHLVFEPSNNIGNPCQNIFEAVQDRIDELEAENKELREALGVNNPWPITDVLLKLIESTEYLLDVKNYDKTGWEEVSYCTKLGREMLKKIEQALILK